MPFSIRTSIAHFSIPMGLLALGLNGLHLQSVLMWDSFLPRAILTLGWVALLLVGGIYGWQWFRSETRETLLEEWHNPFNLSMFPAVTLTLLLFILSLKQIGFGVEFLLWGYFLVALVHTLLTFHILSRWVFQHTVRLNHLKPTWFIMLSANFVVVIVGHQLLSPEHSEFLWFYFSISLLLWFSFVFMMVYRLMFEHALRPEMRPSLFIFLAPPSLALIASVLLYERTGLELSMPMVWSLYGFAMMFFLFWITAIRHFMATPLSMSSWAYVYPISAFGVANQFMFILSGEWFFLYFGATLFALNLSFVILLLAWLFRRRQSELL